MIKRNYLRICCGSVALLAITFSAKAVTNVTVKVTVVESLSCVINDNMPIEVNFGEVMTTRVDGSNYRQLVKYGMSCTGQNKNAMKLQVQGNSASFNSSLLRTSATGLGIQLLNGDSKLPVNSWLNFTYPNIPKLYAVPVQQDGVTLGVGEFTAGATMKVDYQ